MATGDSCRDCKRRDSGFRLPELARPIGRGRATGGTAANRRADWAGAGRGAAGGQVRQRSPRVGAAVCVGRGGGRGALPVTWPVRHRLSPSPFPQLVPACLLQPSSPTCRCSSHLGNLLRVQIPGPCSRRLAACVWGGAEESAYEVLMVVILWQDDSRLVPGRSGISFCRCFPELPPCFLVLSRRSFAAACWRVLRGRDKRALLSILFLLSKSSSIHSDTRVFITCQLCARSCTRHRVK